jgi:hypothetical protein
MNSNTARFGSPSKGLSTVLKIAPFAILLAASSPALAQRDDPGLQLNCANDFFRLCAGVDPNSGEADKCMNRNRPRLSAECKAAIGDFDKREPGKIKSR